MRTLAAFLLLLCPLHLKAETTLEIVTRCETELTRSDRILNAVYSKLLKGSDDPRKKRLQDAQKSWIHFRDREAVLAADQYRGGTLASIAAIQKKIELTQQRTRELEIYLYPEGQRN